MHTQKNTNIGSSALIQAFLNSLLQMKGKGTTCQLDTGVKGRNAVPSTTLADAKRIQYT